MTELQQTALRFNPTTAPEADEGEFVEVALAVRLFTAFTYRIPKDLSDAIEPGVRVLVPFRGQPKTGVVMARTGPPEDEALLAKTLPVGDVLDAEPLLGAEMLEFLEWTARYYMAPIGDVVRMALPAVLFKTDGRRVVEITEAGRRALEAGVVHEPHHRALLVALTLGDGQVSADQLRKAVRGLTFSMLSACERAEWITSQYVSDTGEDVGVKKETIIRLVRDPYMDERLGKLQEEILIRLQAFPTGYPITLGELRQQVRRPHNALRRLESRGILSMHEEEVYRDPFAGEPVPERFVPELTADQARVIGEVRAMIEERSFQTYLLHGVTGSGKTEVYIRLIRAVLEQGRRAIVLLPEISLTPQFVAVFRSRFDEPIAILHSRLSDGERYDEWRRINRGEVSIVIGARSALFAPMEDVGIIVVDEEHDGSFKQERACRYNARDLAQVRGRVDSAVVVLGSATPAVETYLNARQGKIGYLPMASRVNARDLPKVEIVDMRTADKLPIQRADSPRDLVFSCALAEGIERNLRKQEQTILFLNRRGHSPFVQCAGCGRAWRCTECAVSLTYHDHANVLRCHYCDHIERMPSVCPDCGGDDLGFLGTGTEKLTQLLLDVFPKARVARLDRDTGARGLEVIRAFRDHKLDVLIGTQMVTKGHDIHNVTLVGVIMADMGLNLPDFRAGERTFQILTQVAGRAGRGLKTGRVLVQTFSPWHYALDAARQQNYSQFVQHELQTRRELAYPPFASLASLLFEGADEGDTARAAQHYANVGRRLLVGSEAWRETVSILGPAHAPLARLRGLSRWQMLFKGKSRTHLRAFLTQLLTMTGYYERRALPGGIKVVVDVDPQNML